MGPNNEFDKFVAMLFGGVPIDMNQKVSIEKEEKTSSECDMCVHNNVCIYKPMLGMIEHSAFPDKKSPILFECLEFSPRGKE